MFMHIVCMHYVLIVLKHARDVVVTTLIKLRWVHYLQSVSHTQGIVLESDVSVIIEKEESADLESIYCAFDDEDFKSPEMSMLQQHVYCAFKNNNKNTGEQFVKSNTLRTGWYLDFS